MDIHKVGIYIYIYRCTKIEQFTYIHMYVGTIDRYLVAVEQEITQIIVSHTDCGRTSDQGDSRVEEFGDFRVDEHEDIRWVRSAVLYGRSNVTPPSARCTVNCCRSFMAGRDLMGADGAMGRACQHHLLAVGLGNLTYSIRFVDDTMPDRARFLTLPTYS